MSDIPAGWEATTYVRKKDGAGVMYINNSGWSGWICIDPVTRFGRVQDGEPFSTPLAAIAALEEAERG